MRIYISFFLKAGRKRNVYCSVVIRKVQKQFSTGLSISPEKWEKNNKQYKFLKSKLDKVEQDLLSMAGKFDDLNIPLTSKNLIDIYNDKLEIKTPKHSVLSAYSFKKNSLDNKNSKTVYDNIINIFQKFINIYQFGGSYEKVSEIDIDLSSIDIQMMTMFDEYMKDKVFYSTRRKYLKYFFTMLRYYANKHQIQLPYNLSVSILDIRMTENDKLKKMSKQKKYLSREEEKIIDNTILPGKINNNLLLFKAMKESGMAYAEITSFDPEKNITTSIDGEKWIVISRKKTVSENNSMAYIPFTNKFEIIYNQIDFSNINYNRCSKSINSIGKRLLGRNLNLHMGRHTFAVRMLEKGYSMEAVSRMLGHSNLAITASTYAEVTLYKLQEERKKLQSI